MRKVNFGVIDGRTLKEVSPTNPLVSLPFANGSASKPSKGLAAPC